MYTKDILYDFIVEEFYKNHDELLYIFNDFEIDNVSLNCIVVIVDYDYYYKSINSFSRNILETLVVSEKSFNEYLIESRQKKIRRIRNK